MIKQPNAAKHSPSLAIIIVCYQWSRDARALEKYHISVFAKNKWRVRRLQIVTFVSHFSREGGNFWSSAQRLLNELRRWNNSKISVFNYNECQSFVSLAAANVLRIGVSEGTICSKMFVICRFINPPSRPRMMSESERYSCVINKSWAFIWNFHYLMHFNWPRVSKQRIKETVGEGAEEKERQREI